MSDDEAFPKPYRKSNGWTLPDEDDDDVFVPTYPPVTQIDRDFAYAAPLVVPSSSYATASLILGVATFVTMGITGVPAVIFGHLAIRDTKTGARSGRGMAVAGLVLGYLSIAGWVLFLLLLAVGAARGPSA